MVWFFSFLSLVLFAVFVQCFSVYFLVIFYFFFSLVYFLFCLFLFIILFVFYLFVVLVLMLLLIVYFVFLCLLVLVLCPIIILFLFLFFAFLFGFLIYIFHLLFLAAHLAESQVAKLFILGSQDIKIWYTGSLSTISEIVVLGFILTCPPGVNRVN